MGAAGDEQARGLEVTIRKQAMVTPSEPTPQRMLWTSNVDLIVPRIHVQTVYFFGNDRGSADFLSHETLAAALAQTLVPFYPVAGRLKRGGGGRVEINCNAQGVLLVEAEADAVVAELGEFAPDPRFRQLVPQVDYSQEIFSFPLLVLQITFFKCGGASLGVGMQHHVVDGISGIHFINSWSEMARGMPLKVQPFIDRSLLKANCPPAPKYPHIEYQPPPRLVEREIANVGHATGHEVTDSANSCMNGNGRGVNGSHVANGRSNEDGQSNGVDNGMHHRNGNSNGYGGSDGAYYDEENSSGNSVSNEAHLENCIGNHGDPHSIGNQFTNAFHKNNRGSNGYSNGRSIGKVMKEEDMPIAVRVFRFAKEQLAALKQMAVEGKPDVILSSYEMLAGHIWKCVTQARKLEDSQETKLIVATDGRSRLNPPLPEGYFGNVLFTCSPIATAGELVANPVTYAARKIHDALARMNDDYLRSALDYLEVQEDVSKLVRGAPHFNSPNLAITSWARMPVYDCDFGWGRPIFMGPSAIAYEGLSYVLASPVNDGSLSLSLGLRADHMATFATLVTDI